MTDPQAHLLIVDDDERIRGLLQKFLIRNGFLVTVARDAAQARRLLAGRIGTQLFLERVYPRCLPLSGHNLLVPNPEWFPPQWLPLLPRFAAVLCKTRHAVDIFDRLGCATRYIGFTSEDRLDTSVPRERAFFHLAGRSQAKGTQVLLEAWRRHPEWPRLTVVQSAKTAQPGPPAANIARP